MTAADSASLSPTAELTIELWVKFETLPSAGNLMTFISKYNDDAVNQRSYLFRIDNNAGVYDLILGISNDGTATEEALRVWTPSTATWYHLAVTWKGSTSTAKFYVDGVQLGADYPLAFTALFDSTSTFGIGAGRVDTTPIQFIDGVIDDVRIWNTVRTVTQIADNRSIELTGSESGLQAYWPFESALGPTTTTSTTTSTSTTSTSTSTTSTSSSTTSTSSSTSVTTNSTSTTSTSSSTSTTSTSTTSTSTSTTSTSTTSTSSSTTTTLAYFYSVEEA